MTKIKRVGALSKLSFAGNIYIKFTLPGDKHAYSSIFILKLTLYNGEKIFQNFRQSKKRESTKIAFLSRILK
jgi:hypothetical protein